ncbi:hypothetical protein SLS62_006233 [Diatrype stigma]|uniref:Uncharacterized protein n=1 Tax=Diatrype stigma TaxID=117547 RepID=A0AAN9V1C7_9PEZI
MIFPDEPEGCLRCDTSVLGHGVHDQCDYEFRAHFRFPNGGIADVTTTLHGPLWWKPSRARVTHKEIVIPDKTLPEAQEKVQMRLVVLHGLMHSVVWHRIDVKDSHVIRYTTDRQPIRNWAESSSHKAYTHKDAGGEFSDFAGEEYWMSYHYQLEEFINRSRVVRRNIEYMERTRSTR